MSGFSVCSIIKIKKLDTRICKRCGYDKPESEFRPRQKTCRQCYRDQANLYWEETREIWKEHQKEQYECWVRLLNDLNELVDFDVKDFNAGSYKHQVVKSYVMAYGASIGAQKAVEMFIGIHFPDGLERKRVKEILEQIKKNWRGLPQKFKKREEERKKSSL